MIMEGYMAITPQFKVNQLAKDLGMKGKDLNDFLTEKGVEIKTQRNLEAEEFNYIFDELTKANQITNIEDYIDGNIYTFHRTPSQSRYRKGRR